MRALLFGLTFFIIAGCQFNSGHNENLLIVGKLNKNSHPIPLIYNGPISSTSKKYFDQRVNFSFESNLISNSKFIFLEYVKIGTKQLKLYDNVTSDYSVERYLTDIYDIGAHPINIKYENVIGRNIFMYAEDRTRFKAKIKSIVLIVDKVLKKPYFAAVVDLSESVNSKAIWANTSTRINPFPFTKVQDDLISEIALTYFDSLAEFHVLQEQIFESKNSFESEEDEVHVFDARPKEKYVLVRHNWLGSCASISFNYSALYHVTPSGWVLETEGVLSHFFIDLIDTDGDFYPELLMGEIGNTVIYEINYKGFNKKRSLGWSSSECAC